MIDRNEEYEIVFYCVCVILENGDYDRLGWGVCKCVVWFCVLRGDWAVCYGSECGSVMGSMMDEDGEGGSVF